MFDDAERVGLVEPPKEQTSKAMLVEIRDRMRRSHEMVCELQALVRAAIENDRS